MIKILQNKYRIVRINDNSEDEGLYILGISYEVKEKLKDFIRYIVALRNEYPDQPELVQEAKVKFRKQWLFPYDSLVGYGSTNKIKQDFIRDKISNIKITRKEKSQHYDTIWLEKTIESWRCCAKGGDVKNYHNDTSRGCMIIHEDFGSAWNCVKQTLKEPDAMIIIKI